MVEIAAPTLAQHQDVPTLSWEEDFENMDFDDADFDDMLAEMDMEVITGGSTMNECQQQQSGCHQQQQPPIIDRSAECLSISSGSAMVRQPPITDGSAKCPSIIGGSATGRCHQQQQ